MCRYGIGVPKPGPTSSQVRFSKLNTTTERYVAGGAAVLPHGEPLVGGAAVVVVLVVVLRSGFAVLVVLDPQAVASRTTAVAMRVVLRVIRTDLYS